MSALACVRLSMYSQAPMAARDDERHPHEAGVGEVDLVLGQLHGRRRDADDDHQRHEQLGDRDAEVAAGGVEAEREALAGPRGRRTRCSPSTRRSCRRRSPRSRRTPSSTQNWVSWPGPASQPLGTTTASSRHGMSSSEALIAVHSAAAEARHGERVGDPQERRRSGSARAVSQNSSGQRQRDAGVAEVEHDDRPQHPDAEADVLGEDREDQVLAGDRAARAAPRSPRSRAPSRRSSGLV